MKMPALPSVLKVARWEFIKHIKSPVFILLTLALPLIMLVMGGITFFVEERGQEQALHLGIADRTGEFYSYLEDHREGELIELSPIEAPEGDFAEVMGEEGLDAVVLVEEAALEQGSFPLYVEEVRDYNLTEVVRLLNSAAASYRIEGMGLDPQEVQEATAPIELNTRTVTGEDWELANFLVPLIAGLALIFSVIFSGQILMYGVIKEKRNRVVEILLSSISSLELLLGKIAGFGALSFCQIVVWLGSALLVMGFVMETPALPLSAGQLIPPLLFFVFGYLLLSSVFAAVGATMKEAEGGSQAQGMVILVPMIPVFLSSLLLMDPFALWVRILSHLPPFIPTTMLLRMGGADIPPWEMATSLTVLILSTGLFIYLGARIFEGTILQYQRAAGWKDLKLLFARK